MSEHMGASMENELRRKLRELIEMWAEVAYIKNLDDNDASASVYENCMNNLEDVLNGDYSCLQR